jgi:recombination protein RecT
MNALVAFEQQLQPLAPRFAEVLPANVKPDRLIRTVVISVERLPKLLDCDRQSLFNAAMSAAILGLEVDGVTGQAYLIPFKTRAQLVVGYKGYNTMGARSGLTVDGTVVREGDAFDYELGDRGYIRHKPVLGSTKRIIGAWATAASLSRPPIISVLGIDDIMAIMKKSPGAKMSDSPWNDPTIGFPAMASKSAKRRLARSMPLNVMQYAARMEEAFEEQGKPSWISPDRGVIVDGEAQPLTTFEPNETPTAAELIGQPSPHGSYLAADQPAPAMTPNSAAGAGEVLSIEDEARKQAKLGSIMFNDFYKACDTAEKKRINAIGDELRGLMNDAKQPA